MAYEEIADIYGISENEVEDVIKRAMAKYDEFTSRPRRKFKDKEEIFPLL